MASNANVQFKERAAKAYAAMELIGVPKNTVTPHLKRLLQAYENEWEFIEAENYRVLMDEYFEQLDAKSNSRELHPTRANGSHEKEVPNVEPPSSSGPGLVAGITPALGSSSPNAALQYSGPPRPNNIPPPTRGQGSSLGGQGRPASASGPYSAVDPQSLARALNACSSQTTTRPDSVPEQVPNNSHHARSGINAGSPSAAAAAAREREKGKSPLVEEIREKGKKSPLVEQASSRGVIFRDRPLPLPTIQNSDTPLPKLISVKLEVSPDTARREGTNDSERARKGSNFTDLGPEPAGPNYSPEAEDPSSEIEPFIPLGSSSSDIIVCPTPLQVRSPYLPLSTYVKTEPGSDTFLPPPPPLRCHPTGGWIADNEASEEHCRVSPSADPPSGNPQVLPSDEIMGAAKHHLGRNPERAPSRRESSSTLDSLKQCIVSSEDQLSRHREIFAEPHLAGDKGFVLVSSRTADKRSATEVRDGDSHPTGSTRSAASPVDLSGDAIRPNFILSGTGGRQMNRSQDFATDPAKRLKPNAVTGDGHAPAHPREDGAPSQIESRAGKRKAHSSDPGPNPTPSRLNGHGSVSSRPTLRSSHSIESAGGSGSGSGSGAGAGAGSSSRRQRQHSADLPPVKIEIDELVDLMERKPKHDASDISRGTEKLPIPFINEFTSETINDNFNYISSKVVYQMAYINISLARIGDEDCCADCTGNCLDAPHPCPCSRETGGEYAYTPDGRLKPGYIEHELMRVRDADRKRFYTYCSVDCPIERAKNDTSPEKCKGHQLRKFVKECWHKCGCGINCGNRVVQRGIVRRLEVFFTNTGKGWGIRAAEFLPAGTFVCEYVGEILTNMELDQRNQESKHHGRGKGSGHKDTYPVLLDGDWFSERGLKDEEALCLDATKYGNVARFINHRCVDANLIDLPVSIEGQDRHYYHVAFFTSRDVVVGEELTWDYTIDFGDKNHPIEAFRCLCGSAFCTGSDAGKRNKKHKR